MADPKTGVWAEPDGQVTVFRGGRSEQFEEGEMVSVPYPEANWWSRSRVINELSWAGGSQALGEQGGPQSFDDAAVGVAGPVYVNASGQVLVDGSGAVLTP